jgi:DNA-3-methyladenine glycosylase I
MARTSCDVETGPDGITRCRWCIADPLYIRYHDTEWGFPSRDDRYLFEKICLEGFQSGLSWLTILRKRENFRAAFRGFQIERVARFTRRDVERLLGDAGIVRHRGKIESAINNARRALELLEAGPSLASFVWGFAPEGGPRASRPRSMAEVPPVTPESKALSKALRQRGWSFIGPTTAYAFMQAVGIVNDHLTGCDIGRKVEEAALRKRRPGPPRDGLRGGRG